jgi:chemotaxis protein histidine kinase CheA
LIENRREITLKITKQLLENYQQIKQLMNQCQLEPQSQDEDQKESLIFSMEQCGFKELSNYHESDSPQSSPVTEEMEEERPENHSSEEFLNENLDMTNISSNQFTSHGPFTKSVTLQPLPPPSTTAPTSSAAPRETPRSRVQFTGTIALEEFEKIPSHIRGRCSLHDTQRLLTYLRSEYAKSSGGSTATPPPMNIQQLDQLGYRVCGQTGLCMLKTLQKLGYVTLSKRGDLVSLAPLGMQGVAVQKRRR